MISNANAHVNVISNLMMNVNVKKINADKIITDLIYK